MIEPTVGRKIWYRPDPDEGLVTLEGQPLDANIVAVHNERLINIAGFDAVGTHFARRSVELLQEGDARPNSGFAEWMPYQVKKASEDNPAA